MKNSCLARESNLGRMARRERGACLHGPVTSEQRRQAPQSALARRVALLDGLRCVARRSQIHWGYAPSSRLAQAKNQSATRHAWVFQQSLNQRSGSRAPGRRKRQCAERQRTPCFKRRSQDYAGDRDWLVASRPLRRRLRRRCRCFFPLCHSKSLNGRSSIVER